MEIKNDLLNENIIITADVEKAFSYAVYHTDARLKVENYARDTMFSFIHFINVENTTINNYHNLKLEINFIHDAFKNNIIYINNLDAYEKKELFVPFISVDKDLLDDFLDVIPSVIKLELKDLTGCVISSLEIPFDILPISQLSDIYYKEYDDRLFAKFINPESSYIKDIAIKAKDILKRSIIAYQNSDKLKMLEEIEAVYKAIHTLNISYNNPANYNCKIQRIRLDEEILKTKLATCLDISILFLSVLESLGYNPILQIIKGHALCGVFLKNVGINSSFKNGIEKDLIYIKNLIDDGSIIFINAVDMLKESSISLNSAITDGNDLVKKEMDDEYFSSVDVKTAHKTAFSPIPAKKTIDILTTKIAPEILNEEKIKDKKEYKNVLKEEEKSRFSYWCKKLLDLSENNLLVNFNLNDKKALRLISENDLSEIIFNDDSFKISLDFTKGKNKNNDNYYKELENNSLLKPSYFNPGISNKNEIFAIGSLNLLQELIRKSNQAMEESGSQTLYICFGLLTYKRKNNTFGNAPFMILPIEKITKIVDKYVISFDNSDFMINQTFFEYYKNENPDYDFSGLYSSTYKDGYRNIANTFKMSFNAPISLDENVFFIANLTFSHYIMWTDIRKRSDELLKNKIIESIINNKSNLDYDIDNYIDIDDKENYFDFAAPIPYDSTQLKAILECAKGKSFILDGPPGTGKSQTIVNMIVNSMYHGKTVLFVAEKKAALDVVYDRLEKIGLSRFVLELHSNKANKDNFYNKLSESMDLGMCEEVSDFSEYVSKLNEKKEYIKTMMDLMHLEKPFIKSLYESILEYEKLSQMGYEYKIDLDTSYLHELTNDNLLKTIENINKLKALIEGFRDYENNPIRFIENDNIRFLNNDLIFNEFNDLYNKYKVFNDILIIFNNMTFNIEINNKNVSNLISLFEILIDLNYYDNIKDFNDEFINNTKDIITTSKELYSFIKKNENKYNFDKFKNYNFKELLTEYKNKTGFKKFLYKIKIKKIIKDLLNDNYKYEKKNIIDYLNDGIYYNETYNTINNENGYISSVLGIDFINNIKDINNISDKILNTNNVCNLFNELNIESNIKINDEIKNNYLLLKERYNEFKKLENDLLVVKYDLNYNELIEANINYDMLLESLINKDNILELQPLSLINKVINNLKELKLNQFVKELKLNIISIDDLLNTYKLSLSFSFINEYLKDDAINFFNGENFKYEVLNYIELIKEYSNKVLEQTISKITSKFVSNSIDFKDSSKIGRLKKIFSMKRSKPSIRDTLINYDDLIKTYFPCILMSPISCAQYLPIDSDLSKFDIVIFDEASQIPTHEAVGAVARGDSLIVAGDPKQMPPSMYFRSQVEISDDYIDYEDSASLLDECIAIGMPRIRLKYHYRSHHESLISFSNQYFYKNELYTFPQNSLNKSELEFNYVKSDKKNTNITKDELEMLLSKIKDIYNKHDNKSLGIIVFNIKQKEIVEAYLNKEIDKDIELKNKINEAEAKTKEPLFIKSIENVQGDERDIIILLISFRLSKDKHPIINGPIATAGGERRLNVAASRSKDKMIIISTIDDSDFEDDDKLELRVSKGALYLKKLIEYSKSLNIENKNYTQNDNLSIIKFIKDDLCNLGYSVDLNVGLSKYKIHLAIKDGDKYSLGIIVDTNDIKNTSIRDEYYLQNSFLTNNLCWNIINIYAIDYYKNPKKVIDYIISNINKNNKIDTYEIKPDIKIKEKEEFNYETIPYINAKVLKMNYSNIGFDESLLRLNLQNLIDVEGPISYETIKKRIKDNTENIVKLSKKAEEFIEKELSHILVTKTTDKLDKDKTMDFYWPVDKNIIIHKFRLGDFDINNIAKEELASAMRQILKIQGKMSKDDLFKATLEAFKFSDLQLNSKNKTRLNDAYEFGFKSGFIEYLD